MSEIKEILFQDERCKFQSIKLLICVFYKTFMAVDLQFLVLKKRNIKDMKKCIQQLYF